MLSRGSHVPSDLGYGSKLPSPDDLPPGVIKVPPHHPGGGPPLGTLADYPPAPWGLYRPFTVLPGYLPLPSPLLINRFAGMMVKSGERDQLQVDITILEILGSQTKHMTRWLRLILIKN